jgi:RimJ/RimL family protein N-acetyltransferase
VVRRVRADEWERLRALRLEALRDTPIGFLETYEAALAKPDEAWRDWAERGAAGDRLALYVAETDGGEWAGMCGVFVDDDPRVAHLVAMFVAPPHRGRAGRVAERLVDAATRWARDDARARALHLFVHEDNARARAFYMRIGFTETGHAVPDDLDPSRAVLKMARPLAVTPPSLDCRTRVRYSREGGSW